MLDEKFEASVKMGRKMNEIFLHGISRMQVRYFTVNHS